MTTQAIASFGTLLKLGDGGVAGVAVNIDSSIIDDGSDYTLVKTATAHGLWNGQPITIAGVTDQDATALNGDWFAEVVNTDYIRIPVATTGAVTGGPGTVTPVAETFTTVAEVGDIKPPNVGNEKEEVTVHTTPGRSRDYKVTLAKDQTLSFPINWDPQDPTHDGVTGLLSYAESGEQAHYKIVFTDDLNTTWAFSAICEDFQPDAPVSGILRAEVTLAVCGQIISSHD